MPITINSSTGGRADTEPSLPQEELVRRVNHYIKLIRSGERENFSLARKDIYQVNGPITRLEGHLEPIFNIENLGLVQGRLVDAIGWAVSQELFYYGQFDKSMQESDVGAVTRANIIEIPRVKKLDYFFASRP